MGELLVTTSEVKEYLRVEGEEEEVLITSLIYMAQDYCAEVLKYELTKETLTLPIKQAIIILAGHFYDERSGTEIPEVVYTLLRTYREVGW